ncbi:MAG: hypothetical protein OSJ27_02170 [Candidatus Gastranaerophilales bacterium]|nr:hypothetical protein [Candidatus Gastranaerophilales bacterium]
MDNSIKLEKIKIKSQHLVSLRQLLAQALTILIGGVVGIWFTPNCTLKTVVIVAGLLYTVVLVKSLHSTIVELNKCVYKELEEIE